MTGQTLIAGDTLIRRRWLLGSVAFAAAWFLLLWPLANALFGLPGAAPTRALQADRLIYEEAVKLVLVVGLAGLAAWLGTRTLTSGTFPPTGMRVPVRMSLNRGAAARWPGVALLLAALLALAFRVASLRVTLELAGLLRKAG